ncbi:hypothetical protein PHYBOEH_007626 [Phytophthora boehmeriae]|uniref:FYVE-type domain-containing protein n=1 Tax=Phytophthora boehmeriae TaxID=109152 RepID=A0A8T1W6U8_9STRA|nr:hypothetical protein PHYBOEH_007626 [Phytophthora boehmeriae]
MTKSLPLPPRFFKCPELTPREQQYLVGKAKESAKALVDATRNNEGPVRWEEAGMHRGVQMYKGEARYPESVVGESITYGCGATTVQATLDEVADFFDLSTEAKMADFVQFNGDMLDGQLLYVIDDVSLLNDPKYNTRSRNGASKMLNANQVTVKWFATETPSKLVKNRDFLTVECQSTFLDVSGRRGWVRSYHSIKLACCPELQNDYNLVRGSFYHTGHVFVESERPGFLDVIFSAQVKFKGSMHVGPLYFSMQKKRLSSIADLQKMITRRRLGSHKFLGDLELVPKKERTRCNLCSTKFGIMTRKARCRKCGEVVCPSCSTDWEVSISGSGLRKVRVCAKCAQNTDPSVFEDMPLSSHHSESVHEDDPENEMPLMSVRAPGYQYAQYERSGSGGKPSLGSGEDYSAQGSSGHRRKHPGRGQRSDPRYSGSYDQDPEYPNTFEMPGSGSSNDFPGLDSQRYTDEYSDEHDDQGQPNRRSDDRRYDPRYRESYENENYGSSPPAYMDQKALQRQQRALQQQQQHQQFLMQKQKQQQALLRRRQQQEMGIEEFQPRMTRQTSLCSSGYSGSDTDEDYSDLPTVKLTSSLLEQHTKEMGPPGPVKRHERSRPRREKSRQRSREPRAPAPAPAVPSQRQLTRLQQMQAEQWDRQEAMFRDPNNAMPSYIPPEQDPSVKPSLSRLDSDSSARPSLPHFFRDPGNSGGDMGGSTGGDLPLSFLKPQSSTAPGHKTVSVFDDEDGLYGSGKSGAAAPCSPVSGMSMNFSALLRPEDLRQTEDNLSLDSSVNSMGESDVPSIPGVVTAPAAAAKDRSEASKTTVVKLYQQILELTKQQHALESQPESDPKEKAEVAKELETLYQKLNAEVEI